MPNNATLRQRALEKAAELVQQGKDYQEIGFVIINDDYFEPLFDNMDEDERIDAAMAIVNQAEDQVSE